MSDAAGKSSKDGDTIESKQVEQGNLGAEVETERFSPEEEAALLQESSTIKAEANALFTSGDADNALARYHDALQSCPNYRHYERAVLHSNVAACHLKLEQWKEAIKASTEAIETLDKLEGDDGGAAKGKEEAMDGAEKSSSKDDAQKKEESKEEDNEVEEGIISAGASKSAPTPPSSSPSSSTAASSSPTKSDILRIRTKSLLRRATARSSSNTWSDLSSAEEDYRTLAAFPPGTLPAADMAKVRRQLRDLPARTKAAQEKEMGEMWGKLRQLGDGILKPFGLSTDNFQMVKDEKTGGYSMNFSQGGGAGGGDGGSSGSS